MKITYEVRNLLEVPQGYYLAHGISADYTLGAGVAKQLDSAYNLKDKLFRWHSSRSVGNCFCVDNVFNLIDKDSRFDTVDINNLRECFISMRNFMYALGATKVALPRIGCGHDKLDWDKVQETLKYVFESDNFEFLVCVLHDYELLPPYDSTNDSDFDYDRQDEEENSDCVDSEEKFDHDDECHYNSSCSCNRTEEHHEDCSSVNSRENDKTSDASHTNASILPFCTVQDSDLQDAESYKKLNYSVLGFKHESFPFNPAPQMIRVRFSKESTHFDLYKFGTKLSSCILYYKVNRE